MAISTEIVGKTFGPFVRDYTFKDLEICALGCGAGWDGRVDLELTKAMRKTLSLRFCPSSQCRLQLTRK